MKMRQNRHPGAELYLLRRDGTQQKSIAEARVWLLLPSQSALWHHPHFISVLPAGLNARMSAAFIYLLPDHIPEIRR